MRRLELASASFFIFFSQDGIFMARAVGDCGGMSGNDGTM
jgi:hypothetical protein